MLELPEAAVLARQLSDTVAGRPVARVVTLASPHRFAFFTGDPAGYDDALRGALRFHESEATVPRKHQLLVAFTDGSFLSATVQMYGGLMCYPTGTWDNHYYVVARERPSPLGDGFDLAWFESILAPPEVAKLSLKAALATEQRIPGLGNGVLQDVLWEARLHPRRMSRLSLDEPCPACGGAKTKEAYLGGSVYVCPACQPR